MTPLILAILLMMSVRSEAGPRPDRNVIGLGTHVDFPVFEADIKLNAGTEASEIRQKRRDNSLPEARLHLNAQEPETSLVDFLTASCANSSSISPISERA